MKNRKLWAKVAGLFVLVVLGCVGVCLAWEADRADVEHTGSHIFTDQGSVDLRGTVKVGGTTLTATATELNGVRTALEINGDLTLANDETIDNATDAKVRVTYNDDATTLGELALESDNAATSVAANDLFTIIGRAYDATTAKTDFASMDFVFTDPTGASEDGALDLYAFVGGTERKLARFAAATTVGAAQVTVAVTSSDWAIDATGAATGMGSITSDGTITAPIVLIGDKRFTGTVTNVCWYSSATNLATFAYSNGVLRTVTKL